MLETRPSILLSLTLAGAGHAQSFPESAARSEDASGLRAYARSGGGWAPLAVDVEASDYTLEAYDSKRGLVAVKVDPDLTPGRDHGTRLRLRSGVPLLVPVPPRLFDEVVEAHRNGHMGLHLVVEPVRRTTNGPLPDGLEVEPTEATFRMDTLQVTAPQQRPPRARTGAVEVGDLSGETALGETERMRLSAAAQRVSERCMQKALTRQPGLRGALTIELERTPVGEPLPPAVVIDGTVCSTLETCLVQGLTDAEDVWSSVPAGSRVYLPLYFKGAPAKGGEDDASLPGELASGPAVNGTASAR